MQEKHKTKLIYINFLFSGDRENRFISIYTPITGYIMHNVPIYIIERYYWDIYIYIYVRHVSYIKMYFLCSLINTLSIFDYIYIYPLYRTKMK